MKTHMDIYNIYKDEPFFQLEVQLSNGYMLFVKWNVFRDKKDNNRPVMITRYTLFDENNKRSSLKALNLTQPVEFKQIEVSESMEEILDGVIYFAHREMVINLHFGHWINSDFIKMINSGNAQITSIKTSKKGCKII